jgi:probable rRNA maturation factor
VEFAFSLEASNDAKASLRSITSASSLKPVLKRSATLVAQTELAKFDDVRIQIVLLSDDELLAINRSALQHDYLTDIITFELERTTQELESEIYISVDRAKANAKRFRATLERELAHLVIHGILHLAGMRDKTTAEMNQMRRRERWFLSNLKRAQEGHYRKSRVRNSRKTQAQ